MQNCLFKSFFLLVVLFSLAKTASNHDENGEILGSYTDYANITSIEGNDLSVSTSVLSGSTRGGTRLYIRGQGFSHDGFPSTVITVNNLECPMIDFLSSSTLAVCDIPAGDYSAWANTYAALGISVGGMPALCTSWYSCLFYFSPWKTPIVHTITPNDVFPGDSIKLYALPYANYISELLELTIDGYNVEKPEDDDDEYFSSTWFTEMEVGVHSDIPTGAHELVFRGGAGTGFAEMLEGAKAQDSLGVEYNIKVHPRIDSISSNKGFREGSRITIFGKGFLGTSSDDVEVLVGTQVPCDVVSRTDQQIICDLERSSLDTEAYFIGHSGLTRYTYTSTSSYPEGWSEKDISLSASSQNVPKYSTERLIGVFYAEESGDHTFMVVADDKASVRIRSNAYNQNKDIEELVFSDDTAVITSWASAYYDEFYQEESQWGTVSLEGGKYYPIEIEAYNGGGDGFFRVGVQAPYPSGFSPSTTVPTTLKISLASEYDLEQLVIKVYGATGGKWKLKVLHYEGITLIWSKESNEMPYDASESEVRNEFLYRFSTNCQVTRVALDSSGAETSVSEDIAGYQYTVDFLEIRKYSSVPFIVSSGLTGSPQTSIVQTAAPSAPVSGSYKLIVDGTYSNSISYDASPWTLWSELTRSSLFFPTSTLVSVTGSATLGYSYYIRLFGTDSVSSISADTSGLSGGKTGVTITIEEYQQADSDKVEHLVIPSSSLFTVHSNPQVTVKVGGILGGCPDFTCDYRVIPDERTPTVTAASFTDSTGEFSLTIDPLEFSDFPTAASENGISVSLGGSTCADIFVSGYDVTCSFELVEGSSVVAGGSHSPVVRLEGFGYLLVTASSIDITPTVASVSPSSGSVAGGTLIEVTGTHFGSEIDLVSVTIGDDSVCEVVSVSSSSLTCITGESPTDGSSTLTLEVNSQSASLSSAFTHTGGPEIDSISASSASPVLKTDVTLTGSGFGTDSSIAEVELVPLFDDGTTYSLDILSFDDTAIEVRVSGGSVGEYEFRVTIDEVGYSTNNAGSFTLEITVESVSPSEGSNAGGQILTITGTNFSPVSNQNQVLIGDEVYCSVISSTSTEITCEVEANDSFDLDTVQTVTVYGRLVEQASCTGICEYTFSSSETPEVTSISTSSAKNGESVVISGSGLFVDDLSELTILIGETEVEEITQNSDTQITFTVPAKTRGDDFDVSVYLDNKGNAEGALTLSVEIAIDSISQTTISTGGAILTISGSGFHSSLRVTLEDVGACHHIEVTETSIVCRAPAAASGTTTRVIVTDFYGNDIEVESWTTLTYGSSSSPTLSSVSGLPPTSLSSFTVSFTGTGLATSTGRGVLETIDYSERFESADASGSSFAVDVEFTEVPIGIYRVLYQVDGVGFVDLDETVTLGDAGSLSSPAVISPYSGGIELVISGEGFDEWTELRVCGFDCEVVDVAFNEITCLTPALVLEQSQLDYYLVEEDKILLPEEFSTDTGMDKTITLDQSEATYYIGTYGNCFIQYDFGQGRRAAVSRTRFIPGNCINPRSLIDSVIEYSNDGVTWETLLVLDATTYAGWNDFQLDDVFRGRFWRFSSTSSSCGLAEWQVRGVLESAVEYTDLTSISCDVEVLSRDISLNLGEVVEFQASITARLEAVYPPYGTVFGGTLLFLVGSNFQTTGDLPTILIDDVVCTDVLVMNSTTLRCVTGPRPSFVRPHIEIIQSLNGQVAALDVEFLYIDKWSESSTWGGEAPPREGDSVWIPYGQNILYDVSAPLLYAVIIEGGLVFDRKDLTMDASYIVILNGGVLRVGTETDPFEQKAVITLHGDRDTSIELPGYGAKVIAVREGKLDLHGVERTITWTKLQENALAASSTIYLVDETDWQVGETIVLASSTEDPFESEEREIASVGSNGMTITLTEPLEFDHYAHIETFGDVEVDMSAEVGLLSRNVVIQGDEKSEEDQFGAQIIIYTEGDGELIGRISYVEIRQAGQAFLVGRHPINFRRVGVTAGSYVRGCSIHHTYNRALCLNGVNYFQVDQNVAYHVMGHSYFIEDGNERRNVFTKNLGIATLRSMSLLNTDTTPATFLITNPNNDFDFNHAAGSEQYGFWFNLKTSATGEYGISVCPNGEALGLFRNNVAHSNSKTGLVFSGEFQPREDPCQEPNEELNPLRAEKLEDFLTFKNGKNGVLAEYIGNVKFSNITAVDNGIAGIEVNDGNFVVGSTGVFNSLIVGMSSYPLLESGTLTTVGIWGPKRENLVVRSIEFFNFARTQSALSTCSGCDGYEPDSAMGSIISTDVSFKDVVIRSRWVAPFMDYITDTDGTLTGLIGGGFVMPSRRYAIGIPACSESETHNGLICESSIQIRRVVISAINSVSINGLDMKVARVVSGEDVSLLDPEEFDTVTFRTWDSVEKSWGLVLPTNYTYNLHWETGVDFEQVTIETTDTYKPSDLPIGLQFNYTLARELFYTELIDECDTCNQNNGTEVTRLLPNLASSFGDYVMKSNPRILQVQVDGEGDVYKMVAHAMSCWDECTAAFSDETEQEDFIRYWSNDSMWPTGQVPVEGEYVEIPSHWTVILDVSTADLEYLEIRGTLLFDETKEFTRLASHAIYIRKGRLVAGSELSPFPGRIEIVLLGEKEEEGIVAVPGLTVGNKVLLNSGSLELFGVPITMTITRLVETAYAGSTVLLLESSPFGSWNVGDQIAIAPSSRAEGETEIRVIEEVLSNQVRLTEPLSFDHYGSSSLLDPEIDIRTEVILLSRNIKIYGGGEGEEAQWGGRILIAKYVDITTDEILDGDTRLDSIEIFNMGQYQTEFAALVWYYSSDVIAEVSRSSIHSSGGILVNIWSADGIDLHDNALVDCVEYGVKVNDDTSNLKFKRNVIFGIRQSDFKYDEQDYVPFTVGFMWKDAKIPSATGAEIQDNIIAGSESIGWYLIADSCGLNTERSQAIRGNVAHSSLYGFHVGPNDLGAGCFSVSYMTAYMNSVEGIIIFGKGVEAQVHHLTTYSNFNGVTLNVGNSEESPDITMALSQSLFIGRNIDPEDLRCFETYGLRLPLALKSVPGNPPINRDYPLYGAKSQGLSGARFTLYSNDFRNFEETGCEEYEISLLQQNDRSPDTSPFVVVEDNSYENIPKYMFIRFRQPDTQWFRDTDCVGIECTGMFNVLLQVLDLEVTGFRFNALNVNPYSTTADSECEEIYPWGGFVCNDTANYASLWFESLDSDRETRIFAPLRLESEDINYYNVLNQQMDHQWEGDSIMLEMLYLARFQAVLPMGNIFTLKSTGTYPTSSSYMMRGGFSISSIVLSIRYDKAGIVKTSVNGVEQDAVTIWEGEDAAEVLIADYSEECGAYAYDSNSQTVTFVLTNEEDCIVEAIRTDSIHLEFRFDVDIDDFYSNDGISSAIDSICAFLGISFSTLKVVEVREGSSIMSFYVETEDSDSTTEEKEEYFTELMEAIEFGLKSGSLSFDFDILDASGEISIDPDESDLEYEMEMTFNKDGTYELTKKVGGTEATESNKATDSQEEETASSQDSTGTSNESEDEKEESQNSEDDSEKESESGNEEQDEEGDSSEEEMEESPEEEDEIDQEEDYFNEEEASGFLVPLIIAIAAGLTLVFLFSLISFILYRRKIHRMKAKTVPEKMSPTKISKSPTKKPKSPTKLKVQNIFEPIDDMEKESPNENGPIIQNWNSNKDLRISHVSLQSYKNLIGPENGVYNVGDGENNIEIKIGSHFNFDQIPHSSTNLMPDGTPKRTLSGVSRLNELKHSPQIPELRECTDNEVSIELECKERADSQES